MADLFETDYDFTGDVSLDEEGRKAADDRQEWLKMSKGEIRRMAFVYYHTVDKNYVAKEMVKAREAGSPMSPDRAKAIGRKVLEALATKLGKPVEQLTILDRLDLSEVKFKQSRAHYQQGLGFIHSRLGMDGPEGDSVWKRLEEPKVYFSTLMLVYPANSRGDMSTDDIGRLNEVRLIPWRMSKPLFMAVWKHNSGLMLNGMSIASQDIKAECTDATYQKIDISLAGPSVWLRNPAYKKAVLEKAVGVYDKLDPFRTISTDQLRAKLGLGGGSMSDVSVSGGEAFSTDNFADVLNAVDLDV